MVVRSDRRCNFSRCNFAYRALVGVGGAGVTRFSVVVDSMGFYPLFFFYNTYLKTYVTDASERAEIFVFALKTCDC